MGLVLNILLHVLLVASLGLFLVMLFAAVLRTRTPVERVIRAGALFSGALIVLASQAGGVSYADFILKSLGTTKPLTFGVLGVVAPGVVGATLAWYLVRVGQRSENLAIRLLAFTGMLASTQFATMYGVALQETGFKLGTSALPNVSFVVGMFLYFMLRYDPDSATRHTSMAQLAQAIMSRSSAARERADGARSAAMWPAARSAAPVAATTVSPPPAFPVAPPAAAPTTPAFPASSDVAGADLSSATTTAAMPPFNGVDDRIG